MAFLGPALPFLAKAAPWLAGGLLGGQAIKALAGGKKQTVAQPGPATRDDAALAAARDAELARRRGAAADRVSTGSEPVGGLGRLVLGS